MMEDGLVRRLRAAGAKVSDSDLVYRRAALGPGTIRWERKSWTSRVYDLWCDWGPVTAVPPAAYYARFGWSNGAAPSNSPGALLRRFVGTATRRDAECFVGGRIFVLGTHHDTTTGKQVVDFCLGARNGPWLPLTGEAARMAALVFAADDPMPVDTFADWLQDTGELVIHADPRLRSGYAFVLSEGVEHTALPIPADAWETEVYTPDGHERFLEKRRIDGHVHNVFAAPGGRVIAQLAHSV